MNRRHALMTAAASLLVVAATSTHGWSQGTALTGTIAYVCNEPKSGLCVWDLAAGTKALLYVSGVNPKFSPDGTRIAFQSSGVLVMNADGTSVTRLTSFGSIPSWSPDGLQIAFHNNGVWVMNADGSQLRQLTTHGRWAAWSPDMTQLAFSSDYQSSDIDLWLVNADGTNARRALVRPGSDIDVAWTPSSRILFAGFVDRRQSYEIFAFDPVTSALTRLTTSPDRDFEPAPSFDGASIAFYSARKPDGIYVMSATGAAPQLVIAKGRQPSWGP